MTMEQFPAPLECYDELGYVSIERFVQFCPVLLGTRRAIRQPKMISFATDVCHRRFKCMTRRPVFVLVCSKEWNVLKSLNLNPSHSLSFV